MNREDVREWLPAFADGELTGQRYALVARAVRQSPELQAEVERYRALRQACHHAVATEPIPAGLRQRLTAQLAGARQAERGRILRLYAGALAAAAAIMLAVGLPVTNQWLSGDERPLVAVDEFTTRHVTCLAQDNPDNLGVASLDPAVASAKLRREFGFAVQVPDLAPEGWQLAAATDCRIPNHRGEEIAVVHVIYRATATPQSHLSVFSLKDRVQLPRDVAAAVKSACSDRDLQRAQFNGLLVMKWHRDDVTYVACGDAPLEDMEDVVLNMYFAAAPTARPTTALLAAQP